MKRIHPDEPRVTAHALGELPEHEAGAVERAVQSDPAVRAAVEETHAMASLIRAGYRTETHELGEARREAIRRAGRQPVAENLVSMDARRRWLRPALVTGAAACLVAAAVWVMQQIPGGGGGEVPSVAEVEQQRRDEFRQQLLIEPAPRPGRVGDLPGLPGSQGDDELELSPEAREEERSLLRELLQNDPAAYRERVEEAARGAGRSALSQMSALEDNPFVSCRDEPRSIVPLIAGTASYPLVERFIRTEGTLPPRDAVRVEELINRVSYEDAGDAELNGVRMGADLLRCPWDEEAILMGVLLRNGSEEVIPRDAMIQVEFKPEQIRSYRLLGYAGGEAVGHQGALAGEGLRPGRSNYVLYQLNPLKAEVFGSHRVVARVGLRLGNENARGLIVPVTGPPRDWGNAGNNLQTAVVLGGWGMLLRESPYQGEMSGSLVAKLARDAVAGADRSDLVRHEALQLVLDSLGLLGADERP